MSTTPGLKGKDPITWLILTLILALSSATAENSLVIKVNDGKLRGKVEVSRGAREFYSFYGVPYGSAPQRFQVCCKLYNTALDYGI